MGRRPPTIFLVAILVALNGCTALWPKEPSSITVEERDDVKVLIATLTGDSSSIGSTAVLARDPTTTCLTDGTHPLALPSGTALEGSGDDVIVVAADGTRFRLGDKVSGTGGGSERREIEGDYGPLPDVCGPPPWTVIHESLGHATPSPDPSPR